MSARSKALSPASAARPPQFLDLYIPEKLWVPLCSPRRNDPPPTVRGGTVLAGQPLVEQAPESSHVALAPVPGTLGTVSKVNLLGGGIVYAVELIVDHQSISSDSRASGQSSGLDMVAPADGLVPGIEHLRRAGVCADRHASPDLIGQLNQIVSRRVDTILCSALDVDSALRLNAAVAAQYGEDVAAGIAWLERLTGARRSAVVIESNLESPWTTDLRAAVKRANVSIIELANDYPLSDPTLMVYTLARRRLRPGVLPTTHGVLLLDAVAALAVGRAARGEANRHTPVAVRDHARHQAYFVRVPIGAPLEFLLDRLNIDSENVMIRAGDLLRDVRAVPDSIIAGGELAIHITPPEINQASEPCIRCGWCLDICPTAVQPALILDAAQRGRLPLAHQAGIHACIECGLCSYVCPSYLPLLETIRELRKNGEL